MVRGLSNITIVGNVGQDPEMQYTTSGDPVTNFSVAVNRRSRTRDGEYQDETNWYRIAAWRRLGETVNQYVSKGDPICVTGRFWVRSYVTQDGREGTSNEIDANEIVFLGRGDADGSGSPGGYRGGGRPGGGGMNDDFGGPADPDDLPF